MHDLIRSKAWGSEPPIDDRIIKTSYFGRIRLFSYRNCCYVFLFCLTDLYNVNDSNSNKLEVKCGVPQGSILGPTLFSLYVNDLPKISEFNVRLFVDDTVLIMNDRDLQNLNKTANAEVKKIENWLSSDKLTLNHDKTNFMLFTPRKKFLHNFAPNMHNKSVNKTSVAKYLGIHVNLKWNDHIKHLCKKVSQICGLFCYLRHYVRQNTLLMLYNSFVLSHLLYGVLTWGSTSNAVLHPLQVLQNNIVRFFPT